MKLGLQINRFTWDGGATGIGVTLGSIARSAEAAGFDSLWVMDHFIQIPYLGDLYEPMLESYGVLSFLAGQTSRIKLGVLVTGVTYRHPAILVKTITTLDVLSGGRAYMGIGAAWFEQEHNALGVPFPSLKERFERLEETLQIAHLMWSEESGDLRARPFEGRHYVVSKTLNVPQPLTKPHPPILIGGSGEQKTLRLVAKYGDACNLLLREGNHVLRGKLDVLRRHCDSEKRAYDEIEKSSLSHIAVNRRGGKNVLSAEQAIEHFQDQADLGFDHAIFSLHNVTDQDVFEVFREDVVPIVHEMRVSGR